MHIRRATTSDAPALARVHVDSWHAAHRGIVPDSHLEGFTCERRSERFRQALASNSEETYVVEQESEIVGFLTLGACRDPDVDPEATGEIWGIYLDPKHWRKGIGRSLCEQGQHVLRSRGYREATLWVLDANDQARRFYEAMGFRADGAAKEVNLGAPLKAVRYRSRLTDAEPSPQTDAQ